MRCLSPWNQPDSKPWTKRLQATYDPAPGKWVRTELYKEDHLRHRKTDEMIAWCGRGLNVWDISRKDKKLYYSDRTSDNAKCKECKRKEKEYMDFKRAIERARATLQGKKRRHVF